MPGVYVVASRSIEPGRARVTNRYSSEPPADLSKTFKSHPRNECFQMYYANVVGVLKETDADHREEITRDLTAGLAPPCNAADSELA